MQYGGIHQSSTVTARVKHRLDTCQLFAEVPPGASVHILCIVVHYDTYVCVMGSGRHMGLRNGCDLDFVGSSDIHQQDDFPSGTNHRNRCTTLHTLEGSGRGQIGVSSG